MKKNESTVPMYVIITLITGLVFFLDSITPLGYEVWLLYAVTVLLSAWVERRGFSFSITGICTILITVGFFLSSRHYISFPAAVFNRTLAVATLWVLAILLELRKQAEQTHQVDQSRLEAVFTAIPGAVVEYNSELRPIRANPTALDAVGLDAMHLGRDLMVARLRLRYLDGRVVSTEDLPSSRALRGEEVTGDQYIITIADGRERIISVSAVPLRRGGTTTGVVVLWHDITQLKQTEKALQENEAKLRAVFDSLVEGVVFLNPRGEVEEANNAIQRIHGHTIQELIDPELDPRKRIIRPDGTPFPAEEQPAIMVLRTGEAVRDIEMGVPTLDGNLRWRLVNAQPVYDDSSVLLGVVVSFFDITARKQAEASLRQLMEELEQRVTEQTAELQESKRDLQRAQAVAQVGSWRMNIQRNELSWSDEVYRIFDVPSGTPLTYEAFLARVHPEDREYVYQQWKAALQGEPYDIQHRILSDDIIKWVREKAELEFDAEGKLQGGFGTVQDITERKQTEEELQESEARLRRILEAGPMGTAFGDASGRITEANDAYLRIIGHSREDLMAKRIRWDAITPPEYLPRDMEAITQAITYGVSAVYEKEYVHPDGQRVPIMIACAYVGSDELVAFVLDITERKQMEEERERLYEQVLATERARAELAETLNREIAHRTKNNLSMVAGLLQLKRMQQQSSEIKAVLSETVSRIMTFASVQEEMQTTTTGWADILPVLRRIGAASEGSFPVGEVTVSVTGDVITLPGKSATNLAIIANELITNAIKHGAPGSDGKLRVDIEVKRQQESLQLCVWNSGKPVPTDFEISRNQPQGMGLQLVGSLIEQYGGSFSLAPQAGGTVAEVVMPLVELQNA